MNNIIAEIQNHMTKCAGTYGDWYCGIASDPRQRLFVDHNVNEKTDAWIYKDCGTENTARDIERHFLGKGCKGDEGGGDWQTKYVYTYKITSHSRE